MAPEPEGNGAGMAEDPEHWGAGGLVGEGRYRLTHRLGRGGMAEVFAAEDVRLGRTVAVKLLRADLAEDPVSKARFTREAQSVAGLNHHAVVAVYDSGEDRVGPNVVPYIVMELVEGRTIRELLISAEAPGPDQALIIVAGVLEALAYSHQHGIVHRDIKPANVIITDTGAVKVMDFGIARALHGVQSTMTQTGMVMGTPQYLSPEQALGKAVDHRSDLYATGCLLYELLALRPPSRARRRCRWSTSTSRTRRSRRRSCRRGTTSRRSSTAWSCARWPRTRTTASSRPRRCAGSSSTRSRCSTTRGRTPAPGTPAPSPWRCQTASPGRTPPRRCRRAGRADSSTPSTPRPRSSSSRWCPRSTPTTGRPSRAAADTATAGTATVTPARAVTAARAPAEAAGRWWSSRCSRCWPSPVASRTR